MIKNILGGVAIGIANIIPGVSGGTIMVILGFFDEIIKAISNVFKFENENRLKDIVFLGQIILGAFIGLVAFANVLDWLFAHYATQTLFWFAGLIALSIPTLLKTELKGNKISIIPLLIGAALVITIFYLSPSKQEIQIVEFPLLTVKLMVELIIAGAVAGGTMLMPGVSGSMVLLIIGEYYLIKSYIANVLSFDLHVLIPLGIIGVGIVVGILLSAKITSYYLEKYRGKTVSFILGLVGASAIVLIPFDVTYTLSTTLGSFIAFIIGAVFIVMVEKLATQ
jgi:putative membrane protein